MRFSFILATFFLFVSSQSLWAQKNKGNAETETNTEKTESLDQKVYKLALEYGDFSVAKHSVYNMLAQSPERTDLLDTLCVLYFIERSYPQSIRIGEKILESNTENLPIREIVAVSYKNVGAVKEALGQFEKLYQETQDLYFLYEIASMQYALQRFGECVTSCDAILSSEQSKEMKVNISINQNNSQDVILAAAVLNMKGFMALEVNQPEAARQNFEAAMEIDPEFVLPKANLQQMEKMATEESPTDEE
jgi:tetratricopeptide (TPR) repeat protein